jgi:tetratricopeptide (TPR) repeat protein
MAVLLAVIFAAALFSAEKYAVLITGDYAEVPDGMEQCPNYKDEGIGEKYDFESFWNDTVLIWKMLIDLGYDDDNIYVLYADKVDHSRVNDLVADNYDPAWHMQDATYNMTDYAATRKNIKLVVDELNSKITDDDFLFVWTYDHGAFEGAEELHEAGLPVIPESEEVSSYLNVLNDGYDGYEKLWDYELAEYFNDMPANKKVYWMQQCFSGGFEYEMTHDISDDTIPFGEHPELDNVFFNSACTWETTSSEADDKVVLYIDGKESIWHDLHSEREYLENSDGSIWNDGIYMHGEFTFHQISATQQKKPVGDTNTGYEDYYYYEVGSTAGTYSVHYSEVDGISSDLYNVHADNVITIKETQIWDSLYQTDHGSRDIKQPTYKDFGGIGYHTALKYPTVIHDEFDNPLSYVFEPIKGEVYIIKDINVKNGGMALADNSETTMFANTSVLLSSKMTLSSNSVLTGLYNNKIISKAGSLLELDNCTIDNVDLVTESGKYEILVNKNVNIFNSEIIVTSIRQTSLGTLNIAENSLLSIEAGSVLTLDVNSVLNAGKNSSLIIRSGSDFYMKNGSNLTLGKDSKLIIEEGANVFIESGAKIDTNGNSVIRGDLVFTAGSEINIGTNSELYLSFGKQTFASESLLKLNVNSKLYVENGTDLTFNSGAVVEVYEGSEIVVWTKAYLTAAGTNFNYAGTSGGNWLGINAIDGSSVGLDNVIISNAETAIKGMGNYKFNVTNSVFENCVNGIDVSGMASGDKYSISGNKLTGIEDGRGITITQSDGVFSNNSISYFGTGVSLILCSPEVVKNEISYNKYFGITISGQNAMPELVNYNDTNQISKLNNVIEKNGYESHSSLFPSGNIGLRPYANVYMRYNDVISSPKFYGISIAQLSPMGNQILIDARSNYWGAAEVTDDYFFGHVDYTIDYTPYFSSSCSDPLADDELTAQAALLISAVELELKGNYTAANRLYEVLMKRHENTPEYYVSMNRLPNLYAKAGWDNAKLLRIYDEAYESEGTTHKKFFKGAKVTANIKGKRYDDAIATAEEMKNEAEYEEEIILADINITIANMLKELDNEGKGLKSNTDHSETLSSLLSKLNGNEEKLNTPTDITEYVLPSQHELFQNYPNPFNPVTQIKFALAKTANVKLSVYNINGQQVAELSNGSRQAGVHAVDFDGSRLNSGVYYYTLETDGKTMTKKMVLTK